MHPATRTALRRTGIVVGALLALGGTFTLGVVAGVGSRTDAPATGVLDDAAAQIVDSALVPVQRDALDAAAIGAMLDVAADPWGSWGDGSAGSDGYTGVGLWLRQSGEALVVSQVAPGSPARSAGIAPGDELVMVDDRATRGSGAAEAAATLRGAPGTVVTLVVHRGATTRTLQLTRTAVPVAAVAHEMVGRGVGRIVVPTFTRGTGREVREALTALRAQHASGVVLDLRGNPGGLLTEAVETASAFLRGGHVVTYTRRDEAPQRLDAVAEGDTRTPLVVLVDGGTASAAEVVAGALQDRGRAVVVGSRTFGKGSVQEPRTLADGSSLALTVARYALPSGRSVEGVGLEPDIQVQLPADAVARAVEVLAGLLVDTGGRG